MGDGTGVRDSEQYEAMDRTKKYLADKLVDFFKTNDVKVNIYMRRHFPDPNSPPTTTFRCHADIDCSFMFNGLFAVYAYGNSLPELESRMIENAAKKYKFFKQARLDQNRR